MAWTVDFAKGHGTRNDFVIVTDPDNAHDPTVAEVAFLCDRRAGIGGDGILRVVRSRHIPTWDGDPDAWFMDYRNADGSIAEMCGNGVRVFAVWLKRAGLVAEDAASVDIGTRAGLRVATYLPDGRIRVWMGSPTLDAEPVTVGCGGASYAAQAVDVGNPHAVSILDAGADLASLDLSRMPSWTPAARFPNETNLEFVRLDGPSEVTMRVFERGVGETWSCGTGTVAVAASVAARTGGGDGAYTVHVPGGTVVVDLDGADAYLTGPAVIVFHGTIEVPDLEDQLG